MPRDTATVKVPVPVEAMVLKVPVPAAVVGRAVATTNFLIIKETQIPSSCLEGIFILI